MYPASLCLGGKIVKPPIPCVPFPGGEGKNPETLVSFLFRKEE